MLPTRCVPPLLVCSPVCVNAVCVCVWSDTLAQGFGAGPLNSLPGKCGTQDVADVLAATMHVVAMDPPVVDADRLSVCGGSHGGFLSLHMVGQHGDVYKAAAVRNPVANMAHMASITDIPDW